MLVVLSVVIGYSVLLSTLILVGLVFYGTRLIDRTQHTTDIQNNFEKMQERMDVLHSTLTEAIENGKSESTEEVWHSADGKYSGGTFKELMENMAADSESGISNIEDLKKFFDESGDDNEPWKDAT